MYAVLDLTFKPTAQTSKPPKGKGYAIVRNDPYLHTVAVAGGWATIGGETFAAQLRLARLTGTTAGPPTAVFTVTNRRGTITPIDGEDILVIDGTGPDLGIAIELTEEQTSALPAILGRESGYWDLQQVGGGTLLAGKIRVLDDVTRTS